MITTVIVEDVEFVRNGIAAIINGTEGFKNLAAFEDCESMLAEIENLVPDILITDIGLPGMSGIEGMREVKKILPNQTIIVLTVHEENENIFEAIMAGASGYLPKKTPPAELLKSIKEAYDGGSPMNSEIAGKVIKLLRNIAPKKEAEELIDLSDREYEILNSLSQGFGYKRIASNLYISIETVRYHIKNIYKKLHVCSQSEAVATAIKRGLI
ncbi:MAG: response regulator transcription factor [Ignavibacteriales bacterium]|nr:response regulator transcription factor [Ignavibacteriales bacterium]MCB9210727.1 response regulator transcription factor [Ignavibacteriales bacterium]MCB9219236.1 response regulator transcription factor [Ignavibacteriales bacterium]MCB9260129.1 response regulator transcription factor [Ignavibacteriales bacterium]